MKFETKNIFYKYGKIHLTFNASGVLKLFRYSLKIRYSHVRYIQQFSIGLYTKICRDINKILL